MPATLFFKEYQAAYFEALQQTRQNEDISIFRKFMCGQYEKYLLIEIHKFESMNNDKPKGGGYSLVF